MSDNTETDDEGACLPAPVNGNEDQMPLDQPEIELLRKCLEDLSGTLTGYGAALASDLEENKLAPSITRLLAGEPSPIEVSLSQEEMELLALGLDKMTGEPYPWAKLSYKLLIARGRRSTANLPGRQPSEQVPEVEP